MDQPAIVDQEIRALQEWLRSAWQQLGNSSLTGLHPPRIAQPDEAMQRRSAIAPSKGRREPTAPNPGFSPDLQKARAANSGLTAVEFP
jgi:hypothetical protein